MLERLGGDSSKQKNSHGFPFVNISNGNSLHLLCIDGKNLLINGINLLIYRRLIGHSINNKSLLLSVLLYRSFIDPDFFSYFRIF